MLSLDNMYSRGEIKLSLGALLTLLLLCVLLWACGTLFPVSAASSNSLRKRDNRIPGRRATRRPSLLPDGSKKKCEKTQKGG